MSGMGVVAEGRVSFWEYGGEWTRLDGLDLEIPTNSKGAFGFIDGRVAVEDQGRLRIYAFKDGSWVEDERGAFTIPRGTARIFEFGNGSIAVMSGTEVDMYGYHDGQGWRRNKVLSLKLPEEAEAAFTVGMNSLGVAEGDRLEFWSFGKAWERIDGASFFRSKECREVFGYHTQGLAMVMDDRIIFYMFQDGSWKEVPSAVFPLG